MKFKLCCVTLTAAALVILSTLSQAKEKTVIEQGIQLYPSGELNLKDSLGKKPIYLKFWASWCIPCREEMKHLQESYTEYGDKIDIVSVNIYVNETHQAIKSTIEEFGLTFPVALDSDGSWARTFEFAGTPYHLLINKEGKIVHSGYEASKELDTKLALLATDSAKDLIAKQIKVDIKGEANLPISKQGTSIVYFTATWCDWYLKDLRPSMSENCVNSQKVVETLAKNHQVNALVTHLWTDDEDVAKYKDSYTIRYPVAIDVDGSAFFNYNIKTFPTMVVFKDGKEVYRTSEFSSQDKTIKTLQEYVAVR